MNHVCSCSVTFASGSGRRRPRFCFGLGSAVGRTSPSFHAMRRPYHLARFMVSLVTEELDLTEITANYLGEKGQPPFHPAMMTALLLYAYCCGIYSSRRIAKAAASGLIS